MPATGRRKLELLGRSENRHSQPNELVCSPRREQQKQISKICGQRCHEKGEHDTHASLRSQDEAQARQKNLRRKEPPSLQRNPIDNRKNGLKRQGRGVIQLLFFFNRPRKGNFHFANPLKIMPSLNPSRFSCPRYQPGTVSRPYAHAMRADRLDRGFDSKGKPDFIPYSNTRTDRWWRGDPGTVTGDPSSIENIIMGDRSNGDTRAIVPTSWGGIWNVGEHGTWLTDPAFDDNGGTDRAKRARTWTASQLSNFVPMWIAKCCVSNGKIRARVNF